MNNNLSFWENIQLFLQLYTNIYYYSMKIITFLMLINLMCINQFIYVLLIMFIYEEEEGEEEKVGGGREGGEITKDNLTKA